MHAHPADEHVSRHLTKHDLTTLVHQAHDHDRDARADDMQPTTDPTPAQIRPDPQVTQ